MIFEMDFEFRVAPLAGEGNDTEVTWVSRTMSPNVEYFYLYGDQPISGTGNGGIKGKRPSKKDKLRALATQSKPQV